MVEHATESQIKGSNSSPQSLIHEQRDYNATKSRENKGTSSRFENFLSMVLAEEVQDGNASNLSDNVLGFVQGNMVGELEDDNFNDPDYNLEEDDEDYHDIVTEHCVMKAKGRPKKDTSNRSNVIGPPTTRILIPQVNENAESDYYDSDELLEWGTDSEDEVEYTEYNAETDNPILEVGMKFASFVKFKEVCMNWGIKNTRQIYFTTNDKKRCICKCKQSGCPFHVFASPISKLDPTIQIKTLNINHIGPTVSDNFHMTPQWIARKYFSIFRADPTWNVSGIIAMVQKDLGYTIEYMKAWKAKRQALKWVYGDEGAQYGKLLRYRADLLNTNPGSTVEIWRDEAKFKGFYVCLAPLKEAFKSGCRPLISLDVCWLKGTYGGNLLAAVAIDPNDCIFPVAYAVIAEAESKETWSWFLNYIGYDLEITNSHHIAFMSDRQKGLIGAVKELFPEAEHRNCVRHMYQNFRQKHKGKALKDLVWNAARASNEVKFKISMERLEQEDREARKWFDHPERPFETWTRALFKTHSRCDMLLNNLCESFNRYILDARNKAIITLLEMIKNKLMKRLYKKKEWINKYQGLICPKIEKKLNKKRGRKPESRRKEAEEIEKKKQAEAQRQAERRLARRGEELAPKKLSKQGSIHIRCSICKKEGLNARGHYKYVGNVVPEARQPFETQELEYLDQFNHDMRDNSQLEVALTNQSAINQEPRQQSIGVECVQDEFGVQVTDVVNLYDEGPDCVRGARYAQDESVDCVQGAGCAQDESVDCVRGVGCAQDESVQTGLSKKSRLYKKNVMKDYVCEASMKRPRKC